MTRKFAVILSCAALALSGCDKMPWNKKKAAAAQAPIALAPEAGAAATQPPPPSKPELSVPSSAPAAAPKPATASAATAPGKPAIDRTASAMCLCYHNIEDKGGSKAMTITSAQFEQEMQALKDNGFTVIGMQDFFAFRRGEKNIPKKSCIITIDDGWISTYTNAWPILKKHGYPFTVFVYINYIGTGGKSMSWGQLEEMRDAGVDIECHTYSHSDLKKAGNGMDKVHAALVHKDVAELGVDGWMKKEIVESKKVLESKLGIKVAALAYPFGNYNAKARELVKEAGYEGAFTVYGQRLSIDSPAKDLLGRYAIEAAKPKIFQDAMKMIGGGAGPAELTSTNTVSQLAIAGMITQPMNNETIQTRTPTIKANLASMGDVEPGSVQVRLSGVGPVPVQYVAETKTMTAVVKQPLNPGSYTVLLSANVGGQKAETRWDFTVAASAPAGKGPAGNLPAPPSPPKVQ
jgi:peptidoglycan/xylan/chitin deacetylase (PgdA/CDA1 family)